MSIPSITSILPIPSILPVRVRAKTSMQPGTDVEFVEEKGRIYLRKVPGSGRGAALVERMAGRGDVTMSTDDILALTRGRR